MSIKNHMGLLIASAAVLIAGCASTTNSETSPSETPAAVAVMEVPSLKVAVDCGNCEVKSTISGLIVEGYIAAAAKAGRKVSTTKEASLLIKEYTARTDTARFLTGALAGKDEIKAVISYQGKTFAVEDYYRNAWLGIDALAKKIGEKALAEIQ